MKNKRNLGFAVAGLIGIAGAVYCGLDRDNSIEKSEYGPFGHKTSFPESFYGRKIEIEQLHPSLRESYMNGYAQEDTIISVLDGKIANIEPQIPQTRF